MNKKALVVTLALVVSTSALAQKAEDQIKFRQSGMTFMAWNMGKIKAQVIDNPAAYNKEQVAAAANTIAAIANSGMGALFAPGTDKGKGWKESRLKPEYFQLGDEVKTVGMAFNREANELAKVAASGDAVAVKAQFAKVGETCGGCHKKFRRDE